MSISFRLFLGACLTATLAGACGRDATPPPTPPPPVEDPDALHKLAIQQDCAALWKDELQREIASNEADDCVNQIFTKVADIERFRAHLRTTDEYATLHGGKLSRLRIDGRREVTADGRPFVRRFVTAFKLLDLIADGQEGQAIAFLDSIREVSPEGVKANGVRVLATLCCWFDLAPDDGQRALPRLFQLAGARGFYVHVTALAGTRDRGMTREAMLSHVAAVGALCAASPVCADIELANENAHPTQQDILKDIDFLHQLRRAIPASVPVGMGSNCCGQSDEEIIYPGGDLVFVHSDRGRPKWDRTRHMREMQAVSQNDRVYVVDDEPMGAGEADSGSRSTDPHEFFARGVMCRILAIGCTFHFSDGLFAVPPGPIQRSSLKSWLEGTGIVPDHVLLEYRNAGQVAPLESPVKDFSGATRVYAGVSNPASIVVALGVESNFRMALRDNWTITETVTNRPGVGVWRVSQTQ